MTACKHFSSGFRYEMREAYKAGKGPMAIQHQTSEEEYKSLSSLLHNVPGVVYRGYPDWSVYFMGRELKKVTGYSSEDFVSGRY